MGRFVSIVAGAIVGGVLGSIVGILLSKIGAEYWLMRGATIIGILVGGIVGNLAFSQNEERDFQRIGGWKEYGSVPKATDDESNPEGRE